MRKLANEWKAVSPAVNVPFMYWDVNDEELNHSLSASHRGPLLAWITTGHCAQAPAGSVAFLLSVLATRLNAGPSDKVFDWLYKALVTHHDGRYGYPFIDEKAAELAGRSAHALISWCSKSMAARPNAQLGTNELRSGSEHFSREVRAVLPTNQTLEILVEAMQRGIPVRRRTELPSYQLGNGCKQRELWKGFTDRTGYIPTTISSHKQVAGRLLAQNGFPVPRHFVVAHQNEAVQAARQLGYPVVVKPTSTDRGIAVSVDIRSDEELIKAFDIARKHGAVLVEEMLAGFDHRLHVINGRCSYVMKRLAAHVVGNGRDTISALLEEHARLRVQDPILRNFNPAFLTDPLVKEMLLKQGMEGSSVPAQGKMVLLRSNSNVSTGGICHDLTATTHPDNILLAERAARCVGLDHAGIDFITTDISRSWREIGGGICEVNPTPAILMQSAQAELLDQHLFPNGDNGRIPVIVVAGAISTTRALLEHIRSHLLQNLAIVGSVIDRRAFHGANEITAGQVPSRTLLSQILGEADLQCALAQVDPDELLATGLDVGYCDLAVLVGNAEVVEKIRVSPHSPLRAARHALINPSIEQLQDRLADLNLEAGPGADARRRKRDVPGQGQPGASEIQA